MATPQLIGFSVKEIRAICHDVALIVAPNEASVANRQDVYCTSTHQACLEALRIEWDNENEALLMWSL
jgi:hypothetical protein